MMRVGGSILKTLLVKPILACNAACAHCASRRALHRSLRHEASLPFADWQTVLRDGRSLGATRLALSGGEPTLYKQLPELIAEGAKLGYHVHLNTNGSLINRPYAEALVKAGVNETWISIYSHRPEVHDAIRGFRGLWEKASQAVRIFSELQEREPQFKVCTQSVILRENIRSLDELIRFHHGLGSQELHLSYLEGDFEKTLLVTEDDISYFSNEVLPRVVQFCEGLGRGIRRRATETASRIYHLDLGSPHDFASGVYQHERLCIDAPGYVLADGSVYPCCIGEYTHDLMMGNVRESTLSQLWYTEAWRAFRTNLHEYCKLCPWPLYLDIPLRQTGSKKKIIQRIYDRLHVNSLVRVKERLKVRWLP
jgi:MoaA/NifB/PqqE/SkfB family radical SAM enzyme